jgi:xylose dehydrogenase (NAD/NADP)
MAVERAKKVRWGILGVAKINRRLIPAFAQARNAELRAIASRSIEKARSAAEADNIPVAHGSYEALLDDASIDAVYIPLPNTLHAEWVRKAADRGKHILCEKPLAPTAPKARAVVEYCKGKNVRLMDGFMWPHHPRTTRLKQFLSGGGIGEVRRVTGAFTFPLGLDDRENIRLRPEMAGGSLLDVGCYPVYGIRWAFGAEPVRVWATAEFLNDVDLAMTGVLWFSDGRIASFDCGFTLPLRQTMEIAGTQGVVTIPDLWQPARKASFFVRRDTHLIDEAIVDGEDQIVHMIENFGRAVLKGEAVTPAPDEAVKTLAVLDALAQSARTGQAVDVARA